MGLTRSSKNFAASSPFWAMRMAWRLGCMEQRQSVRAMMRVLMPSLRPLRMMLKAWRFSS